MNLCVLEKVNPEDFEKKILSKVRMQVELTRYLNFGVKKKDI